MVGYTFDLRDIEHNLRDGRITMVMPGILLGADLINPEVMEDLTSTGLSQREVEQAAEDMIQSLQVILLARELQKRRT